MRGHGLSLMENEELGEILSPPLIHMLFATPSLEVGRGVREEDEQKAFSEQESDRYNTP